jgi:hypothetical protein
MVRTCWIILLICCPLAFAIPAAAVEPLSLTWSTILGGSEADYAHEVQQTSDGGYIVAGYTLSNDGDVGRNHGLEDIWVVKLDGAGKPVWNATLGGSDRDFAYAVQQTSDGGYVVAGSTRSNDGDVGFNHGLEDSWVVKLDGAGRKVWNVTLGGSDYDFAYAVQQTSDGGYVVAGSTRSNDGDIGRNHGGFDSWVVKLDGAGKLVWNTTFGGSKDDYTHPVQQTSDGGYVVAGSTGSDDGDVGPNHSLGRYWILKLDGAGKLVWNTTFGGSRSEAPSAVQQTSDGGFIVAGFTGSNDGDVGFNHGLYDLWVVKLDGAGQKVWNATLGGSDLDGASAVQQTSDGGYVVAGSTRSNDGDVGFNHGLEDSWVVKLDGAGQKVWNVTLGGSKNDEATAVRQTSDGGYIVAGSTGSNDGDVRSNHGSADYYVVKLAGDGSTPVAGHSLPLVLVVAIIVGAVTLVYSRDKKRSQ